MHAFERFVRVTTARGTFAIITLGLAAGLATQGCVSGDETTVDDPVAEQTRSAIQGGTLETGYPTIGMLQFFKTDGLEYICTASLVSQSWVVSAAHCTGTSMRFRTGTNWNDFVDHPVDHRVEAVAGLAGAGDVRTGGRQGDPGPAEIVAADHAQGGGMIGGVVRLLLLQAGIELAGPEA